MTLFALIIGPGITTIQAQEIKRPGDYIYEPPVLVPGKKISGILSEQDIPSGDGGFFRDYKVTLEKGDQVVIDLLSDQFDPMLVLLAEDGSTLAENDDTNNGKDTSSNSLLFARITESGNYFVRVQAYGETGAGEFELQLTRLRPVAE